MFDMVKDDKSLWYLTAVTVAGKSFKLSQCSWLDR